MSVPTKVEAGMQKQLIEKRLEEEGLSGYNWRVLEVSLGEVMLPPHPWMWDEVTCYVAMRLKIKLRRKS